MFGWTDEGLRMFVMASMAGAAFGFSMYAVAAALTVMRTASWPVARHNALRAGWTGAVAALAVLIFLAVLKA